MRKLITTILKHISVFFQDVKRKKGEMERIHRVMKLAGKFEDFWLAYVVTISRSYGVVYSPKKGSQKGSWVAESVPLVDMANTDEGSKINTVWGYNNRDGTFYLNATKKVIRTRTANRKISWG